MKKNKFFTSILTITLFLLFVGDTGYSYYQHSLMTLEGDLPAIVVPRKEDKRVLEDPLAYHVIVKGEKYSNPNRFFAHWSLKTYFEKTCTLFQHFMDPVESVYFAQTLSKTLIQIMLILLITVFAFGKFAVFDFRFWGAVCLVFPLFQTFGSYRAMAIIDASVTYTFFYALPIIFLIIYFMPLFMKYFWEKKISRYEIIIKILWVPLGIVVCLSGPLNPGIALIIVFLLFIFYLFQHFSTINAKSRLKKIILLIKSIPKDYWYFGLIISILSLYSLYIGSFNNQFENEQIPVKERFAMLPQGIYKTFCSDFCYILLLITIVVNYFLLRFSKAKSSIDLKKLNRVYGWIILFMVFYILLLPFGGYRDYRPLIIRYDTFIPVNLLFFFLFAFSTLSVIKGFSPKKNTVYISLIAVILILLTIRDNATTKPSNLREKQWIYRIAESSQEIIEIDEDITIISWNLFQTPQESDIQSQFMMKFKITETPKYYYHKSFK